MERPPNYGKPWDREELVLAFEVYCRTPFQQTKTTNPDVRALALLLGRSAASVARKLGNFGSLDPQLRAKSISGLSHASKLDRQVWDEFHSDWNSLVMGAHDIRRRLESKGPSQPGMATPRGASERTVEVTQRVHQAFFREAVMSSYISVCCVTGLRVRECVVAAHIVPWSAEEQFRADPTNGLCLSATFHCLFDAGLMTISSKMETVVSSRILSQVSAPVQELIARFHGQSVILPYRFPPSPERLAWHRANVFQG